MWGQPLLHPQLQQTEAQTQSVTRTSKEIIWVLSDSNILIFSKYFHARGHESKYGSESKYCERGKDFSFGANQSQFLVHAAHTAV